MFFIIFRKTVELAQMVEKGAQSFYSVKTVCFIILIILSFFFIFFNIHILCAQDCACVCVRGRASVSIKTILARA